MFLKDSVILVNVSLGSSSDGSRRVRVTQISSPSRDPPISIPSPGLLSTTTCRYRGYLRDVRIFCTAECTVFGRKSKHKTDVTAWHGINFHKNNLWNILVIIGNYYENFQNYLNLMLLSSSDTRRTLMHLFLFTNSAHRELVSICTQRIRDRK